MKNALDQLKKYTVIVADTGDFESISEFKPQDATTNPSLILKSAKQEKYFYIIDKAIKLSPARNVIDIIDEILVLFGCEILKIVPGRVSTEVDARLSFDFDGTIKKAQKIIFLYEKNGFNRDRVLIKIAATWEGICAAKILEKLGIHCNLTLLFSDIQAIACANAGVTLISPFVGRILDWYVKTTNSEFEAHDDPGVLSVKKIYDYYKYFGYKTEIMGASFRNIDEIFELAGCDLLTINPKLLQELKNINQTVDRKLLPENSLSKNIHKQNFDEKTFRFNLNENQMATEKLSDGIRMFVKDTIELENIILQKVQP